MPERFPPLLPPRARHLAERFTYGVDEDLARQVSLHPDAGTWFEAQLQRLSVENPKALAVATWFPLLDLPAPVVREMVTQGQRTKAQCADELLARTFARRVLSTHQVHETMVDFWSNLLYVPVQEPRSWPWRADLDRVVRQHALGTYADLLAAVTVHPAMTGYLTNDLNRAGGLNENLGRELLELHSVGRRSGYTERDVVHSARMLTGWTLATVTTPPDTSPGASGSSTSPTPTTTPTGAPPPRPTCATSRCTRRPLAASPSAWPSASSPTTRRGRW